MDNMLSMGNIVGNLIFSGIGFVALIYGKRQGHIRLMAVGGALMAYPYFVSSTPLMFLIGACLTAAAWAVRSN
jgi:hypothetical protein